MVMYASPEDVQATWRPLSDAEFEVAQTFSEWASIKLRARVPNLDVRIAANEGDLADLARFTVAAVVKRAMLNPEGWREEAIDDYRRVRDSAIASGALYVSSEDAADLMPRAFTYGMYSVPLGEPW